MTFKEKSEI